MKSFDPGLIPKADSHIPAPITGDPLIEGFAAIAEMAPQNATEAMLATQMIAASRTIISASGHLTRG